MKNSMLLLCLGLSLHVSAQELYVSTEPASNMATGSIGLRMNARVFHMKADGSYSYRLDPEIMIGASRKWMVHANAYGSNMYQKAFRFEGAGIYAKYRFLSSDQVHSHFRMAAFGRISAIDNPTVLQVKNGGDNTSSHYQSDEIDIDGNNSGFGTGIVATQLVHKLALSASVAYLKRLDNMHDAVQAGQSTQAVSYTFSAGYLLLPRVYSNYHQTNLNLYCEWLGASSIDKKGYYIDVAPAIQFIFNSIARLDIGYRFQLDGTMNRLSENSFLMRFEYNLLNVFKPRK